MRPASYPSTWNLFPSRHFKSTGFQSYPILTKTLHPSILTTFILYHSFLFHFIWIASSSSLHLFSLTSIKLKMMRECDEDWIGGRFKVKLEMEMMERAKRTSLCCLQHEFSVISFVLVVWYSFKPVRLSIFSLTQVMRRGINAKNNFSKITFLFLSPFFPNHGTSTLWHGLKSWVKKWKSFSLCVPSYMNCIRSVFTLSQLL